MFFLVPDLRVHETYMRSSYDVISLASYGALPFFFFFMDIGRGSRPGL